MPLSPCCTAFRAMLAKPRFLRGVRGHSAEPRTSKSRFNPKGLLRPFAPDAGLRKSSKRTRSEDAKQRATTWQAKNTLCPAWPAVTRRRCSNWRGDERHRRGEGGSGAFRRARRRKPRSRAAGAQPGLFRRRAIACALRRARHGRHRRPGGAISQARDDEPPAVRGARHGPRLIASWSPSTRARRPPRSRLPNRSRTITSPRCAARSRRSAARTSISTSKSIPPSSAGSWSSSAAAWSTARCAPNSMPSSTR